VWFSYHSGLAGASDRERWRSWQSGSLLRYSLDVSVAATDVSEFESYITTDGSRPVCLGAKHPCGASDQIFITIRQLRVCWYGALSLTRVRVCRSQLLLILASAVIFGSESHGTCDHILLSQIRDHRDFPFRRLQDSQGYGGGIWARLRTVQSIKHHCIFILLSLGGARANGLLSYLLRRSSENRDNYSLSVPITGTCTSGSSALNLWVMGLQYLAISSNVITRYYRTLRFGWR
jgi:hypothetical protein